LFVLAMLAVPLCASTAFGDDAKQADADTNTTSAVAAASNTTSSTKDEGSVTKIKWNNDVCEIIGIVDHLESVERSPWSDGTPSTLSMFETDIWISVKDRKPHAKNATSTSICNRGAKTEALATYKLCSPAVVKKGDRIKAIEGLRTGSNKAVGCLFDVAVISPSSTGKK
jgi:hypothetical protein